MIVGKSLVSCLYLIDRFDRVEGNAFINNGFITVSMSVWWVEIFLGVLRGIEFDPVGEPSRPP